MDKMELKSLLTRKLNILAVLGHEDLTLPVFYEMERKVEEIDKLIEKAQEAGGVAL